ncbi:hypothetical protein ITI46_10155 [Streptomyces oryzae]|uniref:Uncharacterized protein n=1 Tax=Streptomyces oryzae TaxID=1434886 RepID=A0ABS3X9G5_9ACTN|nr:hypothetical protein [Streptomyces oryzae]MBO8192027.1 hypothetical protein [Streptomyces oryzae]
MRTTLWALEGLEHLFFGNGQRVARRNAWTAVQEDRRRARARHEAETVMNAASAPRPMLTGRG